jgi:hypothetical protein
MPKKQSQPKCCKKCRGLRDGLRLCVNLDCGCHKELCVESQPKEWTDELFDIAEKHCKHNGGEMNNCAFWIFKPFIEKILSSKAKKIIKLIEAESGKSGRKEIIEIINKHLK